MLRVEKELTTFQMSSSQAIFPRILIVVGMVAAVVTILYFTPMPDHTFKSCDRPCHALDWPMICRIQLTVEMYQTMSGVCRDCPKNSSDCNNQFCASADGQIRGIITANRQVPGPSIQVCHNDIMVIDVINKIPGHNLAVHWRGQPQNEAPFMDGVPMITQCPILSYTNFQYRFRASRSGTHIYHAFADSDRANGLFGAFVVRQPDKLESQKKLYDEDLQEHIILLSEWAGDIVTDFSEYDYVPKSILINGKAQSDVMSSLSSFNVKQNRRYRFRIAYASGNFGCPITLSIQEHALTVIALDGSPIQPHKATSITLNKGERLDFVLKTDKNVKEYVVKCRSFCQGYTAEGLALLNYEGSLQIRQTKNVIRDVESDSRSFDTATCSNEIGKLCAIGTVAMENMPKELQQVNRKIYLNFDSIHEEKGQANNTEWRDKKYRVNNITFTFPSSPILSQPEDIPSSVICNELKIPSRCEGSLSCECVHIEHIPLGSRVELVLLNSVDDVQELILHLHGFNFYIVAVHHFNNTMTMGDVRQLDLQNNLFNKNLNSPVSKDTIRIRKNAVVFLRFLADNSGYWLLRDEQSKGYSRGMDVVFQVGSHREMVSLPSGFPSCGSFVGPDFFLI